LEQAARLPPTGSLRPWTYCTLFSLLATTGLRISEALALRFSDLSEDGLQIRETKFRKSRLIPLHPSADAGLQRYLDRRRRVGGADDHVFISLRDTALSYPTVNGTFRALVAVTGFPRGPRGSRPRIHDLRHYFALRVLEACPHQRQQATQHLLALMTYMGHAKLASTYWYFHATPHLLQDIADACERFLKGDQP
jgi:integrase